MLCRGSNKSLLEFYQGGGSFDFVSLFPEPHFFTDIICVSFCFQISSYRVPDGVQLPLVLRDPLLNDMEIYFLSIIPEDSEKGPLSVIFMGCSLLCHFMHGSYTTRLVNSYYSW